MKRAKLRNIFNKKRSSENWQNCKRERNICSKYTEVDILWNTKHKWNKWWQKILENIFFTDKCKTSNNIILAEKNESLSITTKTFPTPLTSILQILPNAYICVNQ